MKAKVKQAFFILFSFEIVMLSIKMISKIVTKISISGHFCDAFFGNDYSYKSIQNGLTQVPKY